MKVHIVYTGIIAFHPSYRSDGKILHVTVLVPEGSDGGGLGLKPHICWLDCLESDIEECDDMTVISDTNCKCTPPIKAFRIAGSRP